MSEYTPTEDEFVARYANVDPRLGTTVRQREAEALRIIAKIKAEAWESGKQAVMDFNYQSVRTPGIRFPRNPHEIEKEAG